MNILKKLLQINLIETEKTSNNYKRAKRRLIEEFRRCLVNYLDARYLRPSGRKRTSKLILLNPKTNESIEINKEYDSLRLGPEPENNIIITNNLGLDICKIEEILEDNIIYDIIYNFSITLLADSSRISNLKEKMRTWKEVKKIYDQEFHDLLISKFIIPRSKEEGKLLFYRTPVIYCGKEKFIEADIYYDNGNNRLIIGCPKDMILENIPDNSRDKIIKLIKNEEE